MVHPVSGADQGACGCGLPPRAFKGGGVPGENHPFLLQLSLSCLRSVHLWYSFVSVNIMVELGHRSKFALCAGGIFICYFYYGILQVNPFSHLRKGEPLYPPPYRWFSVSTSLQGNPPLISLQQENPFIQILKGEPIHQISFQVNQLTHSSPDPSMFWTYPEKIF